MRKSRPGPTPVPIRISQGQGRGTDHLPATKIGERFVNRPIVEASIRQTIGEAYFSLGLFAQALKHLEHARAFRRLELGDDHPDTLETLVTIGTVYLHGVRKLAEAEPFLIEAMNGLRAKLGDENPPRGSPRLAHGVARSTFIKTSWPMRKKLRCFSFAMPCISERAEVPEKPKRSMSRIRWRWSMRRSASSNKPSDCWSLQSRMRTGESARNTPARSMQ